MTESHPHNHDHPHDHEHEAPETTSKNPAQNEQLFGQLLEEMQVEDAVGLLSAAQLGRTPTEVRLFVQTAVFDKAFNGLRGQNQYMIQATGLIEHKLSLGLFNRIGFVREHPLLYHHNYPRVSVFLDGAAADPQDVIQDLLRAHQRVYDGWRDLEEDLNRLAPLDSILQIGYGLLGEMPQPFASAVSEVLNAYNVRHSLVNSDTPQMPMRLLTLDDSYLVGPVFNIEPGAG